MWNSWTRKVSTLMSSISFSFCWNFSASSFCSFTWKKQKNQTKNQTKKRTTNNNNTTSNNNKKSKKSNKSKISDKSTSDEWTLRREQRITSSNGFRSDVHQKNRPLLTSALSLPTSSNNSNTTETRSRAAKIPKTHNNGVTIPVGSKRNKAVLFCWRFSGW